MARFKNVGWELNDKPLNWHEVQVAVLMDIRDELQSLNRLLNCQNFINIPRSLRSIDRRLAIRVPLRKKKKK